MLRFGETFLALSSILVVVACQHIFISVDGQSGVDSDCDVLVQVPCATIHRALEIVRQSISSSGSATIMINPGEYTLENGENILNVNNMTIIGSSSKETVIKCTRNTGLYFYRSFNISIKSITLRGCGYGSSYSYYAYLEGLYIPLQPAALVFESSESISIQSVNIKASNGSGLLLLSSSGSVITETSIIGGKGTSKEMLGGGIVSIKDQYRYGYEQMLSIIKSIISDNNYTDSFALVNNKVPSQGAVTLISTAYALIDSSVITNNSRGLTIYSSCGFESDTEFSNVSMYSNWNSSIAFAYAGGEACSTESLREIKQTSSDIFDTIEIWVNQKLSAAFGDVALTTSDSSNGHHCLLTMSSNFFTILIEYQSTSLFVNSCPTYENVSIKFKAVDLRLNNDNHFFEPGRCYNQSKGKVRDYDNRGKCPIPYSKITVANISVCWDNHNGTLCGPCLDNHSVAINSPYLECVPCDKGDVIVGWILLIVLEFIPVTIMVVIIAVLNVNLNQGSLKSFIFFCQILTIPFPSVSYPSWFVVGYNYQYRLVDFMLLPISIWNFGFINYPSCNLLYDECPSKSICISTNTTPLGAIAFWYVIGFYPFLLLALLYACIVMYNRGYRCIMIVFRPLHRLLARFWRKCNIRPSLPHTIASVYTLCFTQLAATSLKLLHSTTYENELRFFYDGSQRYFSGWHGAAGTLALIVLIVFIIVPVVYLSVYPFQWFQKFLNKVKVRKDLLISVTDIFTAPYKNGTQDTWDYRYYASSHFVLQLLVMVLYYIPSYDDNYTAAIIGLQMGICIMFKTSLIVFRPFKRMIHTITYNSVIFLLVVINTMFMVVTFETNLTYIQTLSAISVSAFLYLATAIGYGIRWFYMKYKYYHSISSAHKKTSRDNFEEPLIEINSSDFHAAQLPDRMVNPSEYEEFPE